MILFALSFWGFGFALREGETASGGGGGCSSPRSCLQGGGGESTGGVSASSTYQLDRVEIGTSFNTSRSTSQTYGANTTLGSPLSQAKTISNTYQTHHPLSLKVLDIPQE